MATRSQPDAGDRRVSDAKDFGRTFTDRLAYLRPGQRVSVPDRIEGPDRTGSVRCVVDLDGALLDVTIDSEWWSTLGQGRIAAAVLESFAYTRSKAAIARMALRHYGHDPHAGRRVPAAEPARPLPDVDDPRFEGAVEAALERGFAVLDKVERVRRVRDEPRPRTVSGPRGMFHVVLVGYAVKSAEINTHGLMASDGPRLALDARDALIAATQPAEVAALAWRS